MLRESDKVFVSADKSNIYKMEKDEKVIIWKGISDKPAFRPKCSQKPLLGHPGLEWFLSQIEKDIFENLVKDSTPMNLNMTKEKWDALRRLDKGSCLVVWCRDEYIREVKNQLKESLFSGMWRILKKKYFQIS